MDKQEEEELQKQYEADKKWELWREFQEYQAECRLAMSRDFTKRSS